MAPAILYTMFTIPENIHWWLSICWTAQQFQRQCFCSASSAIIIIMHTQALFHYNLTRLLSGSAKIRSTESSRAGWLRKPKLPTKTTLLFFSFFFYFFFFCLFFQFLFNSLLLRSASVVFVFAPGSLFCLYLTQFAFWILLQYFIPSHQSPNNSNSKHRELTLWYCIVFNSHYHSTVPSILDPISFRSTLSARAPTVQPSNDRANHRSNVSHSLLAPLSEFFCFFFFCFPENQ